MNIRFLFLLSVLIFNGKLSAQESKTEQIEHLLSDLYKSHLFNGAIVIGEKGQIFFSKGYGWADFSKKVPFTPTTASDGGSNAKTFTAASVLLLAEEGKLKLDDPVQRYLPNYPYPNTTVWNLITHSVGGLPDYDYFFEKTPDTAIVTNKLNLDIISKNKPGLEYPPGTNFYYDNVGFDFGALVVERVSGMSYQEFVKKKIFGPIKMDSTFVRPALFENWKQRSTIGYHYAKDSLQLFDIADREGFHGGGNIWFTATDLYHWGESYYYHPVFSNSLIKKIGSQVLINGKPSYVRHGAWYQGKSKDAFYYWGNVAGFYSWVYYDINKQFTIAFMTNTDMPQWVRPLFTSALINILEGKAYLPIKEPETNTVDKDKLSQIAGEYEVDKLGKAQISVEGSKVNLKLNNGMEYRMHLVDQKTFYVPGFDPWISFSSLKDDKFQKIHWSSTKIQTTGKRIAK